MKYIELPELSRLAQALTHEGPECSVHTRIEAYSCKNIKRDKRLFRSLETAYADEVSHSPPLPSDMAALERESEMTPFGPMQESYSRKTLYLLIATLNVAFPDHEFSDVRPHHFNREESGASVLGALSATLTSPAPQTRVPRTYSSYPPASSDFFPFSVPTSSSPLDFYVRPSPRAPSRAQSGTHPTLYQCLDETIRLADCEVYSYTPDVEFDPHASDDADESDEGSAGEDDEGASDDDTQFRFDDYDVDEAPLRRRSTGSSTDSDEYYAPHPGAHGRRRGALLWSAHWFFLNRKLKRVLFISIWARSKGIAAFMDREVMYGSPGKASNERFLGWEGAVGAGARAMGLSGSAHL
ncbi:Maf1-domain-containing protein [Epithele typhae]|uniref:Maf1-domain-containing protein n=1 Tax=Epithele typhae TaxID=378194 RepID=UPI002008B2D7|nr:Maf1-domain-containing protein [Epithele typhae]KAH9945217.1 Maf1-domain-containing protein [Epithele typhae]